MKQLIKNVPAKSEFVRSQKANENGMYNQRKYVTTIVTFITNNQKMVILPPSTGEALPQGKEKTSREAPRSLQTEINKLC